jgi:hypothetical protein
MIFTFYRHMYTIIIYPYKSQKSKSFTRILSNNQYIVTKNQKPTNNLQQIKRKKNKIARFLSWGKRTIYGLPGHQLREVEGSVSAKKRIRLALFWGACVLNFSNTLSKLDTVASNSFSGIFGCSRVCLGKME